MARFPSEYESCERIVAPDGSYDTDAVGDLAVDDGLLRSMYESMIQARALEERGLTLQRRGDLHFWMECRGLEAAHVGSAAGLSERDWLQTEWRQYGAQIQRGRPLEDILMFWLRGDEQWQTDDVAEAPPYERRTPHIVAVGTEIPQTVGHMWGRKYQGTDEVGLVMIGDGAASKGDFHAGLNFAGVFDVPVVFVILNNQWAISVPVENQRAGETFAGMADGYGFDGVLVDGNDVLAVYRATRRAVEKARSEQEPTLVEALTYRRRAHSSSDDPSRYRDEEAVEAWRQRDPVERYEAFLADRGLLQDGEAERLVERAGRRAREATENAMAAAAGRSIREAFELTYASQPAHLAEQYEELRADRARRDGGAGR